MPRQDGVMWNAASHQMLCSIIHAHLIRPNRTIIERHKIASIRQSKRRSCGSGFGKPWLLMVYLFIFSYLQRNEAFEQVSLNSRIYPRICMIPQLMTLANLVTSKPVKKKRPEVVISELNSHDPDREQVNINKTIPRP